MNENEGQFAVTMDELLDPKVSKKTDKPYYQISVRRTGQGVGEMFVTEDIYKQLKAAGAKMGDDLLLTFKMVKFGGQFETRLQSAELI